MRHLAESDSRQVYRELFARALCELYTQSRILEVLELAVFAAYRRGIEYYVKASGYLEVSCFNGLSDSSPIEAVVVGVGVVVYVEFN